MENLSKSWWEQMQQLQRAGVLVRKNCKKCPDFRHPTNFVRPHNDLCVECEVPDKDELESWGKQYYMLSII